MRDELGYLPFGSAGGALMGPPTHHRLIVETGNDSYQLRHSSHTAKTKIRTRGRPGRNRRRTRPKRPPKPGAEVTLRTLRA